MITLTAKAAEQVRLAAENGDVAGMALRLAARQTDDGSFEYGMGFDEVKDEDMSFESEGVELVFAPQYGPILKGTVIDYVEIEPGQFHFIFMNPNDPNYTPPADENAPKTGGCGGGSCGGGCA